MKRHMITSKRYDGVDCVLVDKQGNPVEAGSKHADFRGDTLVVTGGTAPHKPSSTGRIHVNTVKGGFRGSFFPTVVDLKWVPIVSEGEA